MTFHILTRGCVFYGVSVFFVRLNKKLTPEAHRGAQRPKVQSFFITEEGVINFLMGLVEYGIFSYADFCISFVI